MLCCVTFHLGYLQIAYTCVNYLFLSLINKHFYSNLKAILYTRPTVI